MGLVLWKEGRLKLLCEAFSALNDFCVPLLLVGRVFVAVLAGLLRRFILKFLAALLGAADCAEGRALLPWFVDVP